jgi:hypothetical protein
MPRNLVGASLAYLGPILEHLATTIHEWLKAQGIAINIP